jgi:hypothetical protein
MTAIYLCCVLLAAAPETAGPGIRIVEPRDGQTTDSFLTAVLRWAPRDGNADKAKSPPWEAIQLTVSPREDLGRPVVDVRLGPSETSYRLALRPNTKYFWQATPIFQGVAKPATGFRAAFTTGAPRIDATADDRIRYKNPRPGAHYQLMAVIPPGEVEPLSPWYRVKRYVAKTPPQFERIKAKLPEPVWEGHPEALDAYWYCWKTLCGVWSYAPQAPDHQAVANLIGLPSWGPWGSTMVWDTAFITYFAKYGHAAYPFIEAFDNIYARQHENGFICRETDRENREVYVIFPVNPPLYAWAEWEYYRLSGDKARLAAVFLPIAKQYEWYMTYQRRENGLYWTNGFQEADDSPRNTLAYYAVSATSQQALAALCLARIARTIGRDDMAEFFETEHTQLGKTVNERFWDERHRIYNDLTRDMQFITELEPKKFCKHCHVFWPMLAEIAPADRVDGLAAELSNPATFLRRNGVASLSADSAGYAGGPEGTGAYWRGSVWPPIQCMVQEGLTATGHRDLAGQLARRYHAAVVETYAKQRDITEFLAPDRPQACGVGQFVGWGGIGPVANLLEYILGFEIHVPQRRVVWHITRTEKHGVKNLRLGDITADLFCAAREKADDPCHFTVSSSGTFTLVIVAPHESYEQTIKPGHQGFTRISRY